MPAEQAEPDADTERASARSKANGKGKRVAAIVVVIAVACAAAALAYWWLTRNRISTDDAFIRADIVQVAPRVTGTVDQVFIRDNQHVDKGQALFTLDTADYRAALAKAEANLQAAKASYAASRRGLSVTRTTSGADLERAKAALATARAKAKRAAADADRYRALYKKHEVSRQRLDTATTEATAAASKVRQAKAALAQARAAPDQVALKQSQAATAKARVAQAKAAVEQAHLNLSYTEVRAPQAGKIAQKSVLPGAHMNAGQAALAVVGQCPWVIANFKETQLGRMRVGQPVAIEVDAYPDHDFHGRVGSIQSGTGVTFSLLPPENATGNYVKIVQRVPVKILFSNQRQLAGVDLAPGMSVVPTVDVAAPAKAIDRPKPATETASAGAR